MSAYDALPAFAPRPRAELPQWVTPAQRRRLQAARDRLTRYAPRTNAEAWRDFENAEAAIEAARDRRN